MIEHALIFGIGIIVGASLAITIIDHYLNKNQEE
jgi:uncharacterized protein YneF (UPF0154 family)